MDDRTVFVDYERSQELRRRRISKGLSQAALAERAEVSKKTIEDLENHRRSHFFLFTVRGVEAALSEKNDGSSDGKEGTIRCVLVPQISDQDSDSIPLREGESYVIGRAEDTDIHPPKEDPKASRYHAQIAIGRGSPIVRDLQSKNGTFVNEQKIAEARLRHGDYLRCGQTVWLVEEIDDFEQTETDDGE